jgi:hypothetical protein
VYTTPPRVSQTYLDAMNYSLSQFYMKIEKVGMGTKLTSSPPHSAPSQTSGSPDHHLKSPQVSTHHHTE